MSRYGPGSAPHLVSVPGRINLIGEHIDYHQLPVLPMAIQRNISIAFRVRTDRRVRTVSSLEAAAREFSLTDHIEPGPAGDWANYLKTAAVAVETCWPLVWGIDAAVASDLPVAAGLSSSSALLAGFAIALLRANDIYPTVEDLMAVLPEGEHFVGTRGGGMDHAAVMAACRQRSDKFLQAASGGLGVPQGSLAFRQYSTTGPLKAKQVALHLCFDHPLQGPTRLKES